MNSFLKLKVMNGIGQGIYNPQIHHHQAQYYPQVYAPSSSSGAMGSPYFYGYSMQPSRGAFSPTPAGAQRIQGPPFMYYPTHHQTEGSSSFTTATATTPYPLIPTLQPTRHPFVPSPGKYFSFKSFKHFVA